MAQGNKLLFLLHMLRNHIICSIFEIQGLYKLNGKFFLHAFFIAWTKKKYIINSNGVTTTK